MRLRISWPRVSAKFCRLSPHGLIHRFLFLRQPQCFELENLQSTRGEWEITCHKRVSESEACARGTCCDCHTCHGLEGSCQGCELTGPHLALCTHTPQRLCGLYHSIALWWARLSNKCLIALC